MTDQTYLNLKEAAERYAVSYDRLRRAAYDGRLVVLRDGGRWQVRPAEVERFLKQGGRAPGITLLPRRDDTAAARVIVVAIPKGGTGKTTTTLNLGVALAELGQRVLVVDADPQGSLTTALRVDALRLEWTLQDAIEHYTEDFESDLARAIVSTDEGIDLVPATPRLNKANHDLSAAIDPNRVLKALIDPLRGTYDFILIDTLPYLGVLVQNALVAADEVLIPLQAQAMASDSARLLVDQIQRTRRSGINPRLVVGGFLFTQVEPAATVQRQQMAYAERIFGEDARIFRTTIEDRLVVQESQSQPIRQSLFRYRPTDPVTQSYRALAQEVLYGTL
jgi:chromosome partitioning protein